MKYWKECEQCGGKGYSKQQPLDVTGVNGTIVTATMTYSCPHCVNGKVDATQEIQALLDAQAARIEHLEKGLQEIVAKWENFPEFTPEANLDLYNAFGATQFGNCYFIAKETLKEAE